jgi:hypothetical protein
MAGVAMSRFARELGEAMCHAWGLNPSDVKAIDLRWRPDELPTATVELLTTEGVVREVLALTRAER